MQPITYMTSLFTFYLKGEIKSEQNFISFKVPNTILGLIPLGAQTEKFTISQIASTATNTRLSLKYLLLGILLVLWGFSGTDRIFPAGFVLLLLGNTTLSTPSHQPRRHHHGWSAEDHQLPDFRQAEGQPGR